MRLQQTPDNRQTGSAECGHWYDLAEIEGHRFIAMEHIDGEDLASLLRRIGKLPHEKALELARDICAGLAAAHGLGIVHRDLKPANVMIDGRGNARITDFASPCSPKGTSGGDEATAREPRASPPSSQRARS